jgi:hypothetical protein
MYLQLEQIYSGGNASITERWHFANFFNRIFFCNPNNDIGIYDGTLPTRIAPGLPMDELRWDGVTVFANHVMVWRGNVIRWSDINDGTIWIPVGETSGTGVVTTLHTFQQPQPGGQITLEVDSIPTGWVQGTYVQIPNPATKNVNFYSVVGVSPYNTADSLTVNATQILQAFENSIFTNTIPAFLKGSKIKIQGIPIVLTVKENKSKVGFVGVLKDALNLAAGQSGYAKFTEEVLVEVGDFINIAPDTSTGAQVGQNIFKVITKVSNSEYMVTCLGVGTNIGNHAAGCNVIHQPAVIVAAPGTLPAGGPVYPIIIPVSSAIKETYIVDIKLEDLSGHDLHPYVLPIGSKILPLTANEAGQYRGSGGEDRGRIKNCIVLGETLYIFRNRGIESFQYSGRPEVFIKRDEVTDEGLLGKYLITKVGYDEAYFWGHKDMYKMSDGQLEAVAIPVSKKLLREEFLAGDVDTYFMWHNERDKEVWTFYKPKGGTGVLKAMIYNYFEDSCVFDIYPEQLNNVTIAGGLNFPDGTREVLFGVSNNQILNNGPGFIAYGEFAGVKFWDRLGQPISSEAITIDLDFEDSMTYKYIDTLQLNLWVENIFEDRPFKLWVSLGGRDNLDSKPTWSGGQWVDVSGTGNIVTKINQRISGRFISAKFYSNQPGVHWKIGSYVLAGRKGGTY